MVLYSKRGLRVQRALTKLFPFISLQSTNKAWTWDVSNLRHVFLQLDQTLGVTSKVTDFYTLFAKEKGFGIRIRSRKSNYCILVYVRGR